jgi:hypothetical protein
VANASTSGSRSWNGAARIDGSNPRRERQIAKLAILKAAALFGASRPDLKSADVLKIADSWLAWVDH